MFHGLRRYAPRTCSSEANEGGFEFGSNFMSGWISCKVLGLLDVEDSQRKFTYLVGDEHCERSNIREEAHLQVKEEHS